MILLWLSAKSALSQDTGRLIMFELVTATARSWRRDTLAAFCWTTNRRRSMTTMITSLCRAAATASSLTRKSVYAQQSVPLVDK